LILTLVFPTQKEFLQLFGNDEKFDYILFNEIGDTVDVLQAFSEPKAALPAAYAMLVTTYNHLWEPLVTLGNGLAWKVRGFHRLAVHV